MTNFQTPEDLSAAVEEGTKRTYFVGLDLGQSHDYTALSVIERVEVPILHLGHRAPAPVQWSKGFHVRHLQRLPLGLSYPAIVARVGLVCKTAPLYQNHKLVIDQTGVGRPVYDMFKLAKLSPIGITITGGDSWSREASDHYRVSKGILVSRLQADLHSGDLGIAEAIPESAVLRSELADFQMTHTATGYQTFNARSGRHDDLVLSVAVALWYAKAVGDQKMQKGRTRL